MEVVGPETVVVFPPVILPVLGHAFVSEPLLPEQACRPLSATTANIKNVARPRGAGLVFIMRLPGLALNKNGNGQPRDHRRRTTFPHFGAVRGESTYRTFVHKTQVNVPLGLCGIE